MFTLALPRNENLDGVDEDLDRHRDAQGEAQAERDEAVGLAQGLQVEQRVQHARDEEEADVQHGHPVTRRGVRVDDAQQDEQEGIFDVVKVAPVTGIRIQLR